MRLLPKPKFSPKAKSQSAPRTPAYSSYLTGKRPSPLTVGQRSQTVFLLGFINLFLLGGIGLRLAYLQFYQGKLYQEKARNNHIHTVPKPPVRGSLFDRKGRVLATTQLTHAAYLWPKAQLHPEWRANLQTLSRLLGVPAEEIDRKMKLAGDSSSTLVRIARSLTPAQIIALEEYKTLFKDLEVDVDTVRYYPNHALASHVLGYTGELNAEELAQRKKDGYRLGDIAGKSGLEAAFEPKLRGEWGGLQLEVDGRGKVIRRLGQKEAKPGQDVTLTLDLDLQKAAEAALGDRKGAIVVLDPRDGAVLAMASNPRFDPNIFSKPITPEVWKQVQSKGNPFLNRALRAFPPASTFKIITQTAGMESGKYPPNTILNTTAFLKIGSTAFGEWNHAGFGPIGYVRALTMSSNTFHGQIGRGVGGPTLIKWAHNYGLGQKTGIELGEEESSGLIVDDAWKRKNLHWEWTDGDSVNMSIGQGFTLATPLQMAVAFSVPANGGYRVTPHFLQDNQPDAHRKSLHLKPSTLTTLRKGLRGVVAEGTGRALNVPELPPAGGKSGTAEAPPGKTHTWFAAIAPLDKPTLVVVAFNEHSGGSGGTVAGPMVKKVMDAYFAPKKSPPKPPAK
jgi:penicillin-binding protein 2